jgi:conjugal transfer pilus assembly protein TraV
MKSHRFVLLLPALALAGCSSLMSGVGGGASLSCPMSQGITCKSMSKVYADTAQGDLTKIDAASVSAPILAPAGEAEPVMPLRTRPGVVRVWLAPWEDSDGDLHEGAFMDVRADDGGWAIDPVRERIKQGYAARLSPPPNLAEGKDTDAHKDDKDASPTNAPMVLPGLPGLPPMGGAAAPAQPFVPTH